MFCVLVRNFLRSFKMFICLLNFLISKSLTYFVLNYAVNILLTEPSLLLLRN